MNDLETKAARDRAILVGVMVAILAALPLGLLAGVLMFLMDIEHGATFGGLGAAAKGPDPSWSLEIKRLLAASSALALDIYIGVKVYRRRLIRYTRR